MNVRFFVSTAVAACATTALLVAQTPAPQPETAHGATDGQTITASGCLKAEKDVPGRQPSIAERAGIGEDFILTNAKLVGTVAGDMKKHDDATRGATWKNSFKIEGVDDADLQKHLGHQVEITGKLKVPGAMVGSTNDRTAGGTPSGSMDTLREIHVSGPSAIKMVSARCSAATE